MYERYFGFREMPFSVTHDPRFFYTNDRYEGTFSVLRYGIIWKKGVILLTGEVGTGKTTFLRKLMRELEATVQSIHVFYTYLSFDELVQFTLHDMGLAAKGKNRFEMFREFNEHLVRQFKNGRTVALLIDEAQNLNDESLEGLRLLSNLEVDNEKVLQIVLVGQPELLEKLDKPSMRQLKDRVAIRCGLDSLTCTEVGSYIRHRLEIAGYDGPEIFSNQAVESIATYSGGKPRLINTLCDNALILAYGASSRKVSASMIMDAAGDLGLEPKLEIANVKVRGVDQRANSASNNNGETAIRRDDRPERLVLDTYEALSQPAVPPIGFQLHTVPAKFFHMMTRVRNLPVSRIASFLAIVVLGVIAALLYFERSKPSAVKTSDLVGTGQEMQERTGEKSAPEAHERKSSETAPAQVPISRDLYVAEKSDRAIEKQVAENADRIGGKVDEASQKAAQVRQKNPPFQKKPSDVAQKSVRPIQENDLRSQKTARADPKVLLHTSSERDRPVLDEIGEALQAKGYTIWDTRLTVGRTQGDVRFFFPEDRREAERVKLVVESELGRRGYHITLQLFARDGKKFQFAAPGRIEVWLPPLRNSRESGQVG